MAPIVGSLPACISSVIASMCSGLNFAFKIYSLKNRKIEKLLFVRRLNLNRGGGRNDDFLINKEMRNLDR